MLDSDAANVIQLLTYPLSVIGVALLAIEVWGHGLSIRIESYFDNIANDLNAKSSASFSSTITEGRNTLNEFERDILTNPKTPEEHAARITRSLKRLWKYPYYYLTWLASLLVLVPSFLIGLGNKITGGHALGGIGVMLEFACFLGDTYQVSTLLAGK